MKISEDRQTREANQGSREPASPRRANLTVARAAFRTSVLQGGKGETPMPAALRGGVPNDEHGDPLCFGFNLGQCKDAPLGGRCARGRHVRCHPGCFRKRPFSEHKHSGQAA